MWVKLSEVVPGSLDHGSHLFLKRQIRRINVNGIRGRPQRRNCTVGIELVPALKIVGKLLDIRRRSVHPLLEGTPSGSLTNHRRQVDLEHGIREDNGADVPTVRNRTSRVLGHCLPQPRRDPGSDLGQRRYLRYVLGDPRRADLLRDIYPGDDWTEAAAYIAKLHPLGFRGLNHQIPIPQNPYTGIQTGQRHRPIQGTAVDVRQV